MNDQELLARFRDCLARAEQRERGCIERIESWRLAKRVSTPPESMLGALDNEAWPDLLRERNLVAEEVRLYHDAVIKLEARLPKAEPYRPWVVNLNPAPREQGGGRYGRVGVVTNAGNGKADISYDDGVGMNVDIKKHLMLVADLGFVEKERLRCGCGSGFPSLWCCWSREPAKRETGYAPRVVHLASGRQGEILSIEPATFTPSEPFGPSGAPVIHATCLRKTFENNGQSCPLTLKFADPEGPYLLAEIRFNDGETMVDLVTTHKYAMAPKELLLEPLCGCGSAKKAIVCHPMSRPLPLDQDPATARTEPPEPKHVGACPCDTCKEYDALMARRELEA